MLIKKLRSLSFVVLLSVVFAAVPFNGIALVAHSLAMDSSY